jgi:glucose-6-phosphate dehydrogenase assembly protein OpcA
MPAVASWDGADVDVTGVEKKLSELWAEVTQDGELSSAVRTTVFNLVVHTSDEETANRVASDLGQLAERQPSRSIIIIADRLCTRSCVDAHLTVHCNGASDDALPLCHEHLVVAARGRAADHLDSVVIPLLVPELPTYLWWPGQPPFGHRVFHRLLGVADQLVVDSSEFLSPGDGLAELARLTSVRQGINDFNWGRLTPWRDIIAQFFDGQTWAPYANGIRSIRLEFGSGGDDFRRATSGTLLLLGWIGCRLGWKPETTLDTVVSREVTLSCIQGGRLIPIDIQFRDYGAQSVGRLMRVELVSQPRGEQPARFSVERTHDLDHVHVNMEIHGGTKIVRVVPLSRQDDMELLAAELDLSGHDRLYEQVVDMASQMAGREVLVPR